MINHFRTCLISMAVLAAFVAQLTISPDLFIASQAVSQLIPAGAPLDLSVTAGGNSPFTYQWQLDATNITGAATKIVGSFARTPYKRWEKLDNSLVTTRAATEPIATPATASRMP